MDCLGYDIFTNIRVVYGVNMGKLRQIHHTMSVWVCKDVRTGETIVANEKNIPRSAKASRKNLFVFFKLSVFFF